MNKVAIVGASTPFILNFTFTQYQELLKEQNTPQLLDIQRFK